MTSHAITILAFIAAALGPLAIALLLTPPKE